MKKHIFIFLGMIYSLFLALGELKSSSQPLQSDKPLVAYLTNGKWHFLNHQGREIFQPKELIDIFGYSEGFIRVQITWKNKKYWAFIDLSGGITVVTGISAMNDFHNGRALVSRQINLTDNLDSAIFKFGYIDTRGKLVIPLIYDDATDFNEGLAFVMNNEFRGYIDTSNQLVITLVDMAGNPFSEGFADVNDKMFQSGYIDRNGKIVIPMKFAVAFPFSQGLAFAGHSDTIGFINKSGEFVITSDFYFAKKFSDSVAFVGKMFDKNNPRWALIDYTGKFITDYEFEYVREFSEGIAVVKKNGKWFFIDKSGKYVLQNDYSYIDCFANDLAYVSLLNGEKGYINKKGELVIKLPKADKYFDLRFNRVVY
ncbi:MAG: WG repeat-containing protein [Candidatus Kapaibacteriales bacterium]